MPDTQRQSGRGWTHGPSVWRVLIIFCLIAVSAGLALGVLLFEANRDAIDASRDAIANNRELGCRVGGFLVGTPVVKQPGISQADFEKQIAKALDFLESLKALQCRGLGEVTTRKIERQTENLQEVIGSKGGDRGSGPPGPHGPPGGGHDNGPPPSPPRPGPSHPPAPPGPDCLEPRPIGICIPRPELPLP